MGQRPPNTPQPVDLLSRLLDKSYSDATGAVIAAIARDTERGPLADRLKQFEARAQELADQGKLMAADDPALRALLADFGDALKKDALLIDAASPGVEDIGINAAGEFVRQTTLPGISDRQLAQVGVAWNRPDPEAVNALVQFTRRDAWKDLLAKYGDIEAQVREIALRGMVSGRGPLGIASDLRAALEAIPATQANALMRTLQMSSFRDAVAIHQVANADILEPEIIRIAALDDRTCMSCVALHGTRLALGETVDDHWYGRCTAVTIIRGQTLDLETGEVWFSNRTEEQQRAQMGDAAWEAWRDGAISLQDFPQNVTDPLFGNQIVEASLKGILGEAAQQYYKTAD